MKRHIRKFGYSLERNKQYLESMYPWMGGIGYDWTEDILKAKILDTRREAEIAMDSIHEGCEIIVVSIEIDIESAGPALADGS
jgi:hypothetical protein